MEGPSTASRLAARVGESSGSTSYHLRQLAAAGLVVEDPEHEGAGGRERWWRAAHSSTRLDARQFTGDDAAVSLEYLRAVAAVYATKTQEWLAIELDAPREWREAADLSDVTVMLPPAAAAELGPAVMRLAQEAERRHGGDPDARLVAVQVQVLPLLAVPTEIPVAEAPGERTGQDS
jgi:DNA-binding transcriptional ArsR family regulator